MSLQVLFDRFPEHHPSVPLHFHRDRQNVDMYYKSFDSTFKNWGISQDRVCILQQGRHAHSECHGVPEMLDLWCCVCPDR